ncbi:MAG: hypothetical protein HZB23_01515 [Deltaproteobacteria bacterium]|nr:hypothetical protein [Deltaproteobacteria bacterium]
MLSIPSPKSLRKAAITALVAAALMLPRPAFALLGDSDKAFGLAGSVRGIALYSDPYDFPAFFGTDGDADTTLSGILRVTALGRPTEKFSYEFHAVTHYDHFSASGGDALSSSGKPQYRAWDEAWDISSGEHHASSLSIDRASVKISLRRADLTIGRQAVTFGKAWFWNPLDLFSPFDATQFDRDYKAGVDAIRLDAPFSDFSGATVIYVAGRELDGSGGYKTNDNIDASWSGSALIGRLYATVRGFDLALSGGKVYGGFHAGAGASGEVGQLALRFEAAGFFADDNGPALPFPLAGDLYEDSATAVIGIGHRFDNSLDIEAEYLINSGGAGEDWNEAFSRFQKGAIPQMSRNVLGFSASYEINPLATARISVIQSLSAPISTNISPNLTISLSDNAEAIMGASINAGKRPKAPLGAPDIKSEFGSFPSQFYVEIKQYF